MMNSGGQQAHFLFSVQSSHCHLLRKLRCAHCVTNLNWRKIETASRKKELSRKKKLQLSRGAGREKKIMWRKRRKDSDSFTYTVQNVFFVFLFVLCSLSTSQTEPKRGDQGILLGSPVPPTPPSHPGRPAQGPNPVRWLSQSADKRERKNLVMPRRLTVSQVSSVVSGHSHWGSSAALRRVQLQWITADRDRLKLLGAWLHKKRCSKKKGEILWGK